MQTGARRSLPISIAMLLLLLPLLGSLPPVRALADTPPDPPSTVDIESHSGRYKHPRLDSRLVELAEQASAFSAEASGGERSSLIAVSARVDGDAEDVADAMRARGALVANVSDDAIEAYAPLSQLTALATLSGVVSLREPAPPVPLAVVSQGAGIHGAPSWNDSGYTAAGIKIGVIDIGFQGYSALIGVELPAPFVRCYQSIGVATANISDCERSSRHGTAVAETIVDVAPDATIYISNPVTHLDLHATVDWMISQGVTIVNHSVGWGFEGPGDGTTTYNNGPLAAVDKAVDAGISWINAAGNEAMANWTGDWSDANANSKLEFAPNIEVNRVYVRAGFELILYLRWDDSWTGAQTDLDLYLVNSDGVVIRSSQTQQSGLAGHEPYERIRYIPPGGTMLFIVVEHFGGPTPQWVHVQALTGESLEHRTPEYSIANPAESANAGLLAVGAAQWTSPEVIAPYSSRGPTRDGRIKPEVVGIDQGDTASYGPSGFSGTSQAAPHVAGMAALIKQRYPEFGPAEIANYIKFNATRAANPDNTWGHGLALLPQIDGSNNPLPTITSLSPPSVAPGTPSVVLTVRGTGFSPHSVVRWNGEDRETVFVTAVELRVELFADDLATPGAATITVFSPEPGGGESNSLTFAIGVDLEPAPDDTAFVDVWDRTDLAVWLLLVGRTWIWGDVPIAGPYWEDYEESPDGRRVVLYYDKSRMEISDPDEDRASDWFVTNGLLVVELVTGMMQVGDAAFEERAPAQVNVAGDPNDAQGPTYATFTDLREAPALDDGALITWRVDRDGNVTDDPAFADYGVTAEARVTVPGIDHQVASPFWEFMNSWGLVYENGEYLVAPLFINPFYATGYPITEAYWTTVSVGGTPRDVLVQCFERRCLTYTPDNPEGWQVEAGNVGRHYFIWRYGIEPGV